MDRNREFFACLALRHTPGVGAKTWKAVLEAYPTAYDAVQDAENWPARGLSNKRQAAACAREDWRGAAECEYRDARHRKMAFLSWNDPDYPARLKAIVDPPAYFYYAGDPKLLSAPGVAIVGARDCTRFGLEAADRIARELSRCGVTVISGMAAGIDRQAHQGGLQGLGSTVGVLGTGLDVPYPTTNVDLKRAVARHGCVITEFAPNTPPEGKNFPLRNRIISGLSLGVLVAEASARSGSLITARLAAEQGREVFALPGPVGHATFTGCHRLIRQGASLVEKAEEILEALRYEFALELQDDGKKGDVESAIDDAVDEGVVVKSQPKRAAKRQSVPERPLRHRAEQPLPQLEGDELLVYERLIGKDQLHVDDIARSLKWESSRVSTTLIMLEMKGLLRQMPGMWYTAREA
ncbi:DNA-processing protein DprA [Salidesulfovibrio brasiliensis]